MITELDRGGVHRVGLSSQPSGLAGWGGCADMTLARPASTFSSSSCVEKVTVSASSGSLSWRLPCVLVACVRASSCGHAGKLSFQMMGALS